MASRASKIAQVAQGHFSWRWCAAPMPDRPAPTMRTSRCSTSAATSGALRRDEQLVQRAVLPEQLLPPALDQLVGVDVVGVEAGAVVHAELAPDRDVHEGR